MKCLRGSNAVQCTLHGAGIHPGMNYRLRVITGQGVRRGRVHPEVSWTFDKHKGGVSVLVEPFRTTFVLEINSSGRFFTGTGNYRQTAQRGEMSMIGVLGGRGRHTDS